MAKTKINYLDSEGELKSVMSDELDGKLEVTSKMELINTTSLDVERIVSLEHLEENDT